MGRIIAKNICKSLSGKYSQKHLDHDKQFATDALKTNSKKVIWKTVEATGDLIGDKIVDAIAKLSYAIQLQAPHCQVIQRLPLKQKENPLKYQKKKTFISRKRQQIIEELRII